MALNTLKSKIKYRLSRSKDTVFTPKEFLDLSDRDQVGRVLRQLMQEGQLIRFGYGLYAKADRSPYSGKTVPQKPLPALIIIKACAFQVSFGEDNAGSRYGYETISLSHKKLLLIG